ncbi:hypothetical protein GCM10009774_10290 [Cellulomonas gelida]|uniref:YbaB/EbfC DNA-binding family protein n=2 Tax=Cellulomonadaceae TaxID=85016 RepID=A0A4Y3KHR8_9CELL|nr:hypothetical protein CGE01nite_08180 [Cellulomonas gelida]GGL21935.1 hypothetical protein GCM10009774_10290 [Cellulomonas gelida]
MLPDMSVYSDPDEVLARVRDDIAAAQRRAVAAGEVRDRIDAIRGRASSPRGDVLVEVDVSGRLTDLELADEALDRGGRELSRLVVELVGRAGAEAGARAVAAMEEAFGADDGASAHLRAEVAQRWGATP